MALSKAKQAERQQEIDAARETLLAWLPRGTTVYTTVTSFRGVSTWVKPFVIVDGKIFSNGIGYRAAMIIGHKFDPDRGVQMSGGGMDMKFEFVHRLSAALYGYKDRGDYALRMETI